MDFIKIKERTIGKRHPIVEIYPDFVVNKTKDLMVRGGAFYAVWDEANGLWSKDEYDIRRLVDEALYSYADKREFEANSEVVIKDMGSFTSQSWVQFKRYTKLLADNFHEIDQKLTFADTKPRRSDYASKRLGYSVAPGPMDAYEEIISTLYKPTERAKLEWAIGSIVCGDSRDIQKFIVLYGAQGAGKSTILNIVQKLFDGYYGTFDAKSLGSNSSAFSTECFKDNPLLAIQHDGDLSRIEDNTRLNSIISHEKIMINEKFKSAYPARMNSFLFMATNRPVKITDAKSGIIRRLIDVRPSGDKIDPARYDILVEKVDFELGAIADHCLKVYRSMGKHYYRNYTPTDMMYKTDQFFNFVEDCFEDFESSDYIKLTYAYDKYCTYCDRTNAPKKMQRYLFREELKNYFEDFKEVLRIDGVLTRSVYCHFKSAMILGNQGSQLEEETPPSLVLDQTVSLLDDILADCPAQYADRYDAPIDKWDNVTTKLSDISTDRVHFIRVPSNHIVIDFDLKDKDGNKSADLNILEASKWPATYAEFSKGGSGVHLHYIYEGDITQLSPSYAKDIEVKVFTGKSALRRRLSLCNDIPVATINSGLPMKGAQKVVNTETVKNEKALRTLIKNNLAKEYHPGTKPSIDFIHKILEDAYESGMAYDVSDMRQKVMIFANNSSHQAEYCVKKVMDMKWKSKEESTPRSDYQEGTLVFFDVEVFPNLFLVNWKVDRAPNVCRMINPTPEEIERLMNMKLIGFNCRRYDNHILYARYLGYSNQQLFELSSKIVSGVSGVMFGEAYNISYTDVYDFSSKKQSLKKFEIELGIHHQELGLPWDQPVPEELWEKVAEYCDNDVIATEALFHSKDRQADWTARQILADVAGMSVNDTTNSLTTRIIFGKEKHPQSVFEYRNMGDTTGAVQTGDEFCMFKDGRPVFPGYKYENGKSTYRDEEVGEGGYVYAEPGIHYNVALLDIASMHPSSIVAENLFGDYTSNFRDILNSRIAIKHGDFESARTMLGGKLAKYLDDPESAKPLSQALKIAINSVYGLTSAKFDNPFRDIRNKDNIVAKRGALFMINLKHAVQEQGFTVAHIKTDSIKIPNATPEIISFVQEYGRMYGYNFEHEATYDRMCLVNNAVYIAKYASVERCEALYGTDYLNSDPDICKENKKHPLTWTATGAQFQQPYVFKSLFSKELIDFDDMCEAKSVTSSLYLDMNEGLPEGEHDYHFVGKVGLFCPVIPGCGGGELLREKDGKYYAAPGTSGYRWLEAEAIDILDKETVINQDYYAKMVIDAAAAIDKYGDVEFFINGQNPYDADAPYLPACKNPNRTTCMDCPNAPCPLTPRVEG